MKPDPKNPLAAAAAETASSQSAAAPAPDVSVAYHDGPPSLGYFRSRWERSKPKTVSAADWAAMQARPDCALFDFRVV